VKVRDALIRANDVLRRQLSWWPIEGPFTSVFVSADDGSLALMPVTARTALAITSLYRGVSIYSDMIATMPVVRERGREQMPLPGFVAHPAGLQVGWTDEIEQIVWSLLLRGNAYAMPSSEDSTGYPSSFVVVSPDVVGISRGPVGEYVYAIGDLQLVNPTPDVLLHIRMHRPPGCWCGIGVLDTAGGPYGQLAGVAATEGFATDVMQNPTPPAVLSSPLRLSKQQASDLQGAWTDSTARGRAIPAVLSGGITYTPLQVTPADVQLIESRRWNATMMAVLLGLPPFMLGGSIGDSLTYSTVEGEMDRLWDTALSPVARRIELAMGAWTPSGQNLRFNFDSTLRANTLDRFNAYQIGIANGFLTVDEVRDTEHRPPLPGEQPTSPAAPAVDQQGAPLEPKPNEPPALVAVDTTTMEGIV
jgi:HK97 family phage portal protein